jgi:hypothetical protein
MYLGRRPGGTLLKAFHTGSTVVTPGAKTDAYGSHMRRLWNKCVNHACCTFVFRGDTKAKIKVQQRSLTPLFYDLRICEPYVFNTWFSYVSVIAPGVRLREQEWLKKYNPAQCMDSELGAINRVGICRHFCSYSRWQY